jgi:tungstate transport system substrate-binding protein
MKARLRRNMFFALVAVAVAALVGAIVVYERSQATIQTLESPAAVIDSEPLVPTFPATRAGMATGPTTGLNTGPVVRCAVINGMNFTGFWRAVTDRFTADTGIRVETVSFGEKAIIDSSFRDGGVDLLTMHACDKIINLVADGLARDPQPWARNDLVIVGPKSDPAKIRGLTDAAEAFRRIAATRSPLVVHASLGAQEVLRAIVDGAKIQFDASKVTMLFEDPGRDVLKTAADKGAYTLIGRIPFRIGRLPNAGLELMVAGDPRLRRPYVVVVADPAHVKGARYDPAHRLAAYLTSPETQAWIDTWGRGTLDDRSVFFPVSPRP